ncbi:MAG TPA: hypothetical protein VHD56_17695 [Tepidisphaeraceae bacterium]|nr:hypothetical protein [Tepidisphaeraceae bacterium]
MPSTFSRFLSNGSGALSLSDSWTGFESFSVQRVPCEVSYQERIGSPGNDTSGSALSRKRQRSAMVQPPGQLPPMPEIGRPESYYAKVVHLAEQQGQTHLRESAKVGQYVTLALDPSLSWDEKLKYFRHALKRHCNPPAYPDDNVWMFYRELAALVRQHCGQEALRLASAEDDMYAARVQMGQERTAIDDEAEQFFLNLMSTIDQRPEWFNEEDWSQLKLIRDQWI